MKHIARISQIRPAQANEFQDVFCKMSQVIYDVFGATGGSLPILSYIVEKCDLPTT